jgi:hypothetical protein
MQIAVALKEVWCLVLPPLGLHKLRKRKASSVTQVEGP